MPKIIEIPGKLSAQLSAVNMVSYDEDAEVICLVWRDTTTLNSFIPATKGEFKKLQETMAACGR